MASKLTLSLDPKVIEAAKKYSEKKGVSLSKLVEEYLAKLTKPTIKKNRTSIEELRGILGSMPPDFDYKKTVSEYIYKKHLK